LQLELDILKQNSDFENRFEEEKNPKAIPQEKKEDQKKKQEEDNQLEDVQLPAPKKPKINDQNQQNQEESECVVCLSEKKSVVFMPCKHVACCEICSEKVEECPLCREKVESKIKVFL